MTRLRATIARRLKDAQNTAAMLTTYNEVDMSGIMELRNTYKDAFEKKHGVKMGFMSFFVTACCHALKEVPEVNAEIDGTDIVYKNYVHMGVAVGTPSGLVVPVLRDADQMGFAAIEKKIAVLAYAPFGRTSLFRRAAGKELPAFAKEFDATTWAQFFLKFTLSHPAITAVTPATSQAKNMLDNIGGGIGRLPTAAHRKQIIEFVDALPALPGR